MLLCSTGKCLCASGAVFLVLNHIAFKQRVRTLVT